MMSIIFDVIKPLRRQSLTSLILDVIDPFQNNVLKTNTVLTKQAQHLFDEKKFTESASLYAQTFASFEEVALKFVQADQNDALKTFLSKKLASFNPKVRRWFRHQSCRHFCRQWQDVQADGSA